MSLLTLPSNFSPLPKICRYGLFIMLQRSYISHPSIKIFAIAFDCTIQFLYTVCGRWCSAPRFSTEMPIWLTESPSQFHFGLVFLQYFCLCWVLFSQTELILLFNSAVCVPWLPFRRLFISLSNHLQVYPRPFLNSLSMFVSALLNSFSGISSKSLCWGALPRG